MRQRGISASVGFRIVHDGVSTANGSGDSTYMEDTYKKCFVDNRIVLGVTASSKAQNNHIVSKTLKTERGNNVIRPITDYDLHSFFNRPSSDEKINEKDQVVQ